MAHGGQGALAAPALAPCDPMSLCSHICCARPWECGACRLHMVFITGQIFWLQVKRVLFPVELSCGSMQHNVCRHTDLLCPPAALTWRKEGTCGVEDERVAFYVLEHLLCACIYAMPVARAQPGQIHCNGENNSSYPQSVVVHVYSLIVEFQCIWGSSVF